MININKRSKQEGMVNLLSEDVLANILCLLGPRHLAISRSVCKPWCTIIDDHRLLRADLLPHSVGGIYIKFSDLYPTTFFSRPSTGPTVPNLDYLPCKAIVIDHCNGLLLLRNVVRHVVNPITRQWVQLPPKPYWGDECLVFDPTLSPHYEVFQIPHARDAIDPAIGELEWPPSTCILHVFSSRTNKWKERSFVREGEAAGKVDDLESNWGHIQHNAVYRKGVLYVNCNTKFIMRISLSNEKYQVIKPPGGFYEREDQDLYLGQSEKGVYCATFDHFSGSQVCIYILNESCGEVEWVFKCIFDPWTVLECERIDMRGSWTLQEFEEDSDNEATENGEFEVTVERKFDWDSDNDGVIVPASPKNCHHCERRISFLGFHPYKEVVFLSENFSRGLAYHLNSSKLQDLGHLQPKSYESYMEIESSFPYTPWMGKFPEDN